MLAIVSCLIVKRLSVCMTQKWVCPVCVCVTSPSGWSPCSAFGRLQLPDDSCSESGSGSGSGSTAFPFHGEKDVQPAHMTSAWWKIKKTNWVQDNGTATAGREVGTKDLKEKPECEAKHPRMPLIKVSRRRSSKAQKKRRKSKKWGNTVSD